MDSTVAMTRAGSPVNDLGGLASPLIEVPCELLNSGVLLSPTTLDNSARACHVLNASKRHAPLSSELLDENTSRLNARGGGKLDQRKLLFDSYQDRLISAQHVIQKLKIFLGRGITRGDALAQLVELLLRYWQRHVQKVHGRTDQTPLGTESLPPNQATYPLVVSLVDGAGRVSAQVLWQGRSCSSCRSTGVCRSGRAAPGRCCNCASPARSGRPGLHGWWCSSRARRPDQEKGDGLRRRYGSQPRVRPGRCGARTARVIATRARHR